MSVKRRTPTRILVEQRQIAREQNRIWRLRLANEKHDYIEQCWAGFELSIKYARTTNITTRQQVKINTIRNDDYQWYKKILEQHNNVIDG